MKYIYLDTETTGADLKEHSIYQIAGFIEIDDKVVETFNIKFKPRGGCLFCKDAEKITGISEETIMQADKTYKEGFTEFNTLIKKYVDPFNKMDKFFVVGYNVRFDLDFIRRLFLDNCDNFFGSLFYSNPIDVMVLATVASIGDRPNMMNFKLSTVCDHFKISHDNSSAHDALYDTALMYKLYKKLMT